MKSHGVAVGIGEREGETERSLEGRDQDRDSGASHCIVQIQRIVRLEPDGHTPPEALDGPRSTSGSRMANVMVSVAKTTACSGLTGARTRPRCSV